MPRSNRYILPGYIYHVTHRCHDRRFLLKIGLNRTEYRKRLRLALQEYRISLFAYCITSNHTHLLLACRIKNDISRMMQKLEATLPSTTIGSGRAEAPTGRTGSTRP